MEALKSLGIDWKMLIAQAVNFLILLFILSKLLYKPIINLLDERKQKIEKGLTDAKKSEDSLSKAEGEAEKIIENAYKESNEILANSKVEAENKAKNIIKKAEIQAEEIRKHSAVKAMMARDMALKDAKEQIFEIVSATVSKTVSGLNEEEKNRLSKKALKDIDI